MRILTIKIFILFLIFQTAQAQTDTIYIDCPGIVGGTWTPENRYIARCNIVVPYDSILVIQPGVKIEFQEGYSFKVEGQLNAVGNGSNRIGITPYDGTWKGLSFGTPSGEQDINTSFLAYTDIDCGNSNGTSEAVVLGKHKISSINNIRITNANTGIKITGFGDIDNITACNFEDLARGIVFQYCDVVSEIVIQNCAFEKILERAISISQNQAYLENILISGCTFDNSGLNDNQSGSAVYVTLNDILTGITLDNNNFNSFSLDENSTACIYISGNTILDAVSLEQNDITLCGGEEPTSPNADFGGVYINESSKVFFDGNTFSGNTGKKSGAGYLETGRCYFTDNTVLNNRNNYTGNENFAGAFTLHVGERISVNGGSFTGNLSAKSGGAMYIEANNAADPLDLHFDGIALSSNSASNEGGAILINSLLDTLSITDSEISGNFSSAGSGGCLSVITSAFNDLLLGANNLQDNFVSENSFGGFLFLRHNPAIVPEYGNIRLYDNVSTVTGHNPVRNYSLIYSKIKSFPGNISFTGENVTEYYPVNGYLYHFERLQDGPAAPAGDVVLTITGNEYQGNRCPLLFFTNDSAHVVSELSGNVVQGHGESFGTFVTVECKEVLSLNLNGENYSHLISGSSGGAVSVNSLKEIGQVNIVDVISNDCYSLEGDGGHISLLSGGSDPLTAQQLVMTNSSFSNQNTTAATGGNGGAVYYKTPGNIDSVLIRQCQFSHFKTEDGGGAVYVDSKEINKATIEGSDFSEIITTGGDGAVCLYAVNGNISKLSVIPFMDNNTSFTGCIGQLNGGALSARASREIGTVLIESVSTSNTAASDGDGGHFSLVSQGSDASVHQHLVVSNCTFEGGLTEPYGGRGGAIYYSSPGSMDSLKLISNTVGSFNTYSDGGALYLEAKEIAKISLVDNVFEGIYSADAAGGALHIQATSGNIGMFENTRSTFQDCHSKLSGGAIFVKASKEIGSVILDEVNSRSCYSASGDGGHFAFISGSSDAAAAQQMIISGSTFDNSEITSFTGGNGGAIFCSTPGDLDSLDIRSSHFTKLKSGGNAGAICILVKETDAVNILGSEFLNNSSLDTAGSVYLRAGNGNIGRLWIAPLDNVPSSFISSSSKYDGGALCVNSSREIGLVRLDSVLMEKCYSAEGNGGHLSLVSQGADPGLTQKVNIMGSTFSNLGINDPTGENGGILYYKASSELASVTVESSAFKNAKAVKDGGSLYINAGKIDSFNVNASLFSSSVSHLLSGGAFFVKTGNGLLNGNVTANRFINCTAGEMGGSVYIEDNKYDNSAENITWTANLFRHENELSSPETGGAVYCKGINSVYFVSDSSISQSAGDRGGFAYLEKVYEAGFEALYAYGNSAGSGGVLCHIGDEQSAFDQSTRFFNSTFLFNIAETTGGCFYITDIDSVEIGKPDQKNNFVANQSMSALSNDQVGGGVFYIQDAASLEVSSNSFYVNTSESNGGVGIINNITSSFIIEDNKFLSNQANAGGALAMINSFGEGTIAWNYFSYNSSAEQGGALLLSPSATNSVTVKDNTFFGNNTGKWGGAVASYRPVRLTRNLFRENHLYDVNPNLPHKGTTVYLSGEGNQAVIKNCVFDQNYYEPVESVASVYFDNLQSALPPFSISNCSFFNFSNKHLSVFNDSAQDTLFIENSIFTQRDNLPRDEEPVVYFNETVRSRYCDLIYSLVHDTVNHNYDEYVYFNIGDYFFDSLQFPVDTGNPDPSFNDFHFPSAYGTLRNDLGVSGGPDNPDTNGIFIFHEPVNLPNKFDIIVVSHDCFTYTFRCMGEFVDNYEFFYWFMPDSIHMTTGPELTYTFDNSLFGNHSITALGHDLNNAEVYGFGQYNVNLDIIRINGVSTSYPNNLISVSSVPLTFNIDANIYHENDTPYEWDWVVTENPGVEYTMTEYESACVIEISKITLLESSITVKYTLEACGRELDSIITISFDVDETLFGVPTITFFPEPADIGDTTSFFTVTFNKIMTNESGAMLGPGEVDPYVTLDRPVCPNLDFIKTVSYTETSTVFRYDRIEGAAGMPDSLCNGIYKFDVNSHLLYTQYYRLQAEDTDKEYIVSNNFITDRYNLLPAHVFPNPFRDRISLAFETPGDYFIEIMDMQGQVQKTFRYASISEVTLHLEALTDGFYILHAADLRDTKHLYLKINKITH